MTNDSSNGSTSKYVFWLVTGSGIIGVIAAGIVSIASDARIAIEVAKQHGEEILMIRGEISAIREELKDRTLDRYTGADAKRFEQYLNRRLNAIEEQLDRLENEMER